MLTMMIVVNFKTIMFNLKNFAYPYLNPKVSKITNQKLFYKLIINEQKKKLNLESSIPTIIIK